jgi:hypothetical protein
MHHKKLEQGSITAPELHHLTEKLRNNTSKRREDIDEKKVYFC